MKKLIITYLLTCIMLVACGSSTMEDESIDSINASDNSNTEQNKNETSTTLEEDSKEDTSLTNEDNLSVPSTDALIDSIKSELKMKNSKLPTKFPITDTEFVTAKINKNEENSYSVSFYQTNEFIPVNDATLNNTSENISLIATVEGEKYDNPNKQKELFPETTLDNIPEEMAVDLGQDIVGMEEGAAGSTYLQWKEGRWVLQIKTLSSTTLDNVNIARKMVDYLELNALPVPNKNGRIEVNYPENAANVEVTSRFEEGNIVYSIKANEVPIDVLMMTVVTK